MWRDIPGYNGKYQVNTEGQVRRIFKSRSPRIMTPYHKKMSGSQRFVVKLSQNGKAKEELLIQIVARTFIGEPKAGYVPYHKNGRQEDYLNNIAYIRKTELGKLTGAGSMRKPVAKIDTDGEIIAVYSSARECARKNYMSYQTVIDRCNGKVKSAFAPDGFGYAWDDSEVSMKHALSKIKGATNKDTVSV